MNSFKLIIACFLLFSTTYAKKDLFLKNTSNFYWKIGNQDKAPIPKSILEHAHKKFSWLATSSYYQKYQSTDSVLEAFSHDVTLFTFTMSDDASFKAYYCNRSSNILVVVVPPYGAQMNDLIRFAGIFYDTDVLIVDYYQTPLYGLAGKVCSFLIAPTAQERKKRVKQLTQLFQTVQQQGYHEIIGAAQCYGAWVLLDTQVSLTESGTAGFDKLIIDSCPAGVLPLCEKWAEDPVAVATVGNRMGPFWLSLTTKLFYYPLLASTSFFYKDFFVEDLLVKITIPIMFVHNQQDLLVNDQEFDRMYQAVKHTRKCALISPFKHLHSSLKAKELYTEVVNQFVHNVLF